MGEAPVVTENDHDTVQRLTEIHTANRSFYLSGAPLFTREIIRDVSQQLKKLEGKAGKVSVRGLDGVIVEFPVETGRMLLRQPDTEHIM